MPDLPPSYRVEPDAEFADRLERVLVKRFTAPASSRPTEVQPFSAVPRMDTTPGPSRTDQDNALIDLDPMVDGRRPGRRRLATMVALGAAAAAVFAVALAAVIRIDDEHEPADVPPPTVDAPPPTTTVDPGQQSTPFEGTWLSTDTDGSSQTMQIARSGLDFEVVVRDDSASVCSGAPSTMTGTGRLDAAGALVLPQPVLTCDDGSTPEALDGSSLDALLRDLTFLHDLQYDTLTDNLGPVWARESAEDPSPAPTMPADMWPQSSIDEVREAQGLADSGDPAYTWQVDPRLSSQEPDPLLTDPELWAYLTSPGAAIVERFVREELGWEGFLFSGEASALNADGLRGLVYLRCAPGETNPLYPIAPAHPRALRGDRCAPTIDEFGYEAVSLDLSQPDRRGLDGIWVVSRWTTTRFAQADPSVVETEAAARLEDFLQARIEGGGAEGYVEVFYLFDGPEDVPLLYATTTGAPYERFEIERVSEPQWPHGDMAFTVRLFAEGGDTVVEQPISVLIEASGRQTLRHNASDTRENGQPLPEPYSFLGGEVTVSAAAPWEASWRFAAALTLGDQAEERVELVADPLPVSAGCDRGPAPADAEALATSIQSDPDLVATAPVDVRVGGVDALAMDVTVAQGASICEAIPSTQVVTQGDDARHEGPGPPGLNLDQGSRMRLYLLDHPEGSATRILAIAIVASDARFDAVIDAATPIIESLELHAG